MGLWGAALGMLLALVLVSPFWRDSREWRVESVIWAIGTLVMFVLALLNSVAGWLS